MSGSTLYAIYNHPEKPYGFVHFVDAIGRDAIFIRGGGSGFDLPVDKVDELVAAIYEKAGVEDISVDVLPRAQGAAQARRFAAHYARVAAELIEREGAGRRRQEARDQLVKDFFWRAKELSLDELEGAHYSEYEETCRFFNAVPYDTPEAR